MKRKIFAITSKVDVYSCKILRYIVYRKFPWNLFPHKNGKMFHYFKELQELVSS